jgi:hypothetical protein
MRLLPVVTVEFSVQVPETVITDGVPEVQDEIVAVEVVASVFTSFPVRVVVTGQLGSAVVQSVTSLALACSQLGDAPLENVICCSQLPIEDQFPSMQPGQLPPVASTTTA